MFEWSILSTPDSGAEMVQNRQHGRVDIRRLKYMIVSKIGHERAEKYFYQLGRMFTSRISKSEFDRICIQLIGRGTLRLHNDLIRSILKNASCARECPAANRSSKLEWLQPVVGKEKSYGQSLSGLGFPSSPRKVRSIGNQGCKFRDRPSPLGPHGKTQNVASKESAPNLQSPPELQSLGSRPPVTSVEDGEEVEQLAGSPGVQSKGLITAPLGISVDFSGSRKVLSEISRIKKFDTASCQSTAVLPCTSSLKSWMEDRLEMEGIKVSVGCADLLNNMLDAYLKGLIAPAMSIARSKKREPLPCAIIEIAPGKFIQRPVNLRAPFPLSMLDLRNAAELNPGMLGPNWPVQLEKVLTHSFDRSS
ncbi:hypothetical protein MLD38_013761 [Melastoma candidum]|uniref:Uncharacterized protein n=2 Tax=Melastoma candidum TaxID=119954 RepID=A0ACB9RDR3_9MYRT|nr:hypothetical protein MLD38_013761 [Melastoma candidum]